MSSASFLTPVATSGSVLARTPMERLARAAGANFEQRAGWNVAVSYGNDSGSEDTWLRETVAFADRSHLTKLELQAEPETLAGIVHRASGGLVLEQGRAGLSSGAWWCPVTPTRVLVLAETELGGTRSAAAAITEAAGNAASNVTILDVTCGLAALALVGPGARELLARFCAIDVREAVTPVAGFRPGSVARAPGYVLRQGEDQLLIIIGWALGEYLWQVVADAAENLGGGPIGTDTLGRQPAHA